MSPVDDGITRRDAPASGHTHGRPSLARRLLFSAILVVATGEIAVRVSDGLAGRPSRNALATVREPPDPFRGFGLQLYDGAEIVGRHGDRHPRSKPPGQKRLVCLGGSTTEGHPGDSYPERLAERLGPGWDVINVGNAGYTTAHLVSLLALNVMSWQPDVVIASENVNDLRVAYVPGFQPDYVHALRHVADARAYLRLYTTSNALFQHSEFYWFLKAVPRRLDLWYHFGGWRGLDIRPLEIDGKQRSYGPLPPEGARDAFERNLRSILRVAGRSPVVILGTQAFCPSEVAYHRLVAGAYLKERAEYAPPAEFTVHHGMYNDVIRRVAAEEGATLADGGATIQDCARFTDAVHLDRVGNELLADVYVDAMRSVGAVAASEPTA